MNILIFSENEEALKTIFEELSLKVLDSASINEKIDFILIDNESQLKSLSSEHQIVSNNIKVLCWNRVGNLKEFVLNNGKLSDIKSLLELNVVKSVFEELIKGDFNHETDFQNYQTNTEVITNIFNTPRVFDELIQVPSFENFDPTLIKTSLDHQMMYISYLQQSGIANFPLELSISLNEIECFSTLTVPVNKFFGEYISDSLNPLDAKDSFSKLLSVVLESSNHLSLTYFKRLGVFKIRTFWNKYIKISHVLQINNIESSVILNDSNKVRTFEKFKSFNARAEGQQEKSDFLQKVDLPEPYVDKININDDIEEIVSNEEIQSLLVFAKDKIENPEQYNVAGIEEVLESYPKLNSLQEDDEEVIKIIATKIKEEDLLNVFSNIVDEEEKVNRVSGKYDDEIDEKITVEFTREIIKSLEIVELKNAIGEEYGDEITKIKGFVDEISDKESHLITPYRDEIKNSLVHKILQQKIEEKGSSFKDSLRNSRITKEDIKEIFLVEGEKAQKLEVEINKAPKLIEKEMALESLRSKKREISPKDEAKDKIQVLQIENLKKQLEAYRKANNELHEKVSLFSRTEEKVKFQSSINTEKAKEIEKQDIVNAKVSDKATGISDVEKKKLMQEIHRRDLLLKHLKENVSVMDEQRLEKIRYLEAKLSKHFQAGPSDQVEVYKRKAISAESKLDVSMKAAEIYKRKFDQLSIRLAKSNEKEKEDQAVAIELRSVKRMKIQVEKQLKIREEQNKQIEKKSLDLREEILKSKQQISLLETQLKEAKIEKKPTAISEGLEASPREAIEQSDAKVENNTSDEVVNLKKQNQELQQKLAEEIKKSMQKSILARKSASTPSLDLKEKRMEKHLEQAREQVRKAKDEVTSAKKDLFDLKNENTALNHKVVDLERELNKYKRVIAETKKDAA